MYIDLGSLGGNYKKLYMEIAIKYVELFFSIWHFDLFFVSVTVLPNTDSSDLLKIIVAKYGERKIYPF